MLSYLFVFSLSSKFLLPLSQRASHSSQPLTSLPAALLGSGELERSRQQEAQLERCRCQATPLLAGSLVSKRSLKATRQLYVPVVCSKGAPVREPESANRYQWQCLLVPECVGGKPSAATDRPASSGLPECVRLVRNPASAQLWSETTGARCSCSR